MSIKNSFPSLALCTGVIALLAFTFTAAPSRADDNKTEGSRGDDNKPNKTWETVIAGEIDFALPVDSPAKSGWGFGIRLGEQLHVPLVVLTPEIGFAYHDFSGDFAPTVYRGLAGLRLGIGEIIRPGAFVHLGIGRFAIDIPGSHTAFTYDAGAFLDFTLLPLINLGIHAAYNHINSGNHLSGFQWVTLGAHVALVF
jgi:hypothetical protein